MIAPVDTACFSPTSEQLQTRFLTLAPRIELHARIFFRHLPCSHRKEDAVSETMALAWKWFVRLAYRGKDVRSFVGTFATLAALAVRSGRRLCGQERAQDVLSAVAQQRHGFVVERLPERSTSCSDSFAEALRDNTQTEVPEQVAFRIDFPAWLTTRALRERALVEDMALGERTQSLARKFGVSPGRISQLRREFHTDWHRFCDEEVSEDCAEAN